MFCRKVREFLSQRGVGFIDRDIAEDQEAIAELGCMTTPGGVIDEEVAVGFDLELLGQFLGSEE